MEFYSFNSLGQILRHVLLKARPGPSRAGRRAPCCMGSARLPRFWCIVLHGGAAGADRCCLVLVYVLGHSGCLQCRSGVQRPPASADRRPPSAAGPHPRSIQSPSPSLARAHAAGHAARPQCAAGAAAPHPGRHDLCRGVPAQRCGRRARSSRVVLFTCLGGESVWAPFPKHDVPTWADTLARLCTSGFHKAMYDFAPIAQGAS